MQRNLRLLTALLALVFLVNAAHADIRKTKHNLTKESTPANSTDVCVFCHTPDISLYLPQGAPIVPAKPPAWQTSADMTQEFVIYDDIGRMGEGKDSVGSQSAACLSCHDGTQALSVTHSGADHPFGVPYRGAIKRTLQRFTPANANANPDQAKRNPFIAARKLVSLDDFQDVSQGTIEDRQVFWVSKSGITQRRTRADLPVYARFDDDYGRLVPYIECSSCHDPHTENELFLRQNNAASQLCLTCHIK